MRITTCKPNQLIGALRHADEAETWLGCGKNPTRIQLHAWQKKLNMYNQHRIYIRCNNFAIGRDLILMHTKSYFKHIIDNGDFMSIDPFSAYFFELSSFECFVPEFTKYTILKCPQHCTKNPNDLQHIKGIELLN